MTTSTSARPETALRAASLWHGGGGRRIGGAGVSPDTAAVRFVAGVRLGLVVLVAAAGSFSSGVTGRRADLLLLIGLGWVPWATVVLFASEGSGNRVAQFGGPIGDLALLSAVEVLDPTGGVPVLLGYLVVVVFAVYTMQRTLAGAVGALAVLLAWLSQLWIATGDRLSNPELLAFTAAVVAMVSLLERTAVLRGRVADRYLRLETKAETIVANVADAIVVTDENGLITQCNPAAGRVLGQSPERLVGQACQAALSLNRESRPLDCSAGCALLAGDGRSPEGVEVWRWARPEHRQPLLASVVELTGPDGSREVLHSLRDISRLKAAEEAKSLFLATATHELKTPLTVINGFAETLRAYPDLSPEDRAAALDAIGTRGKELSRIIDRLLLSSRIEAGRVNLSLEPVSLPTLVRERGHTYAEAAGRPILIRADDGLPLAWANVEGLETVIDHLLDNAVKYSGDGTPLELEVGLQDGVLTVAVTDHGVGMDEEQAAHCFERFWQAESTDVRRFGGTGIGLYIVESLVEGMGGTLELRTAPGQGSTFTIRLPRYSEPHVETEAPPDQSEAGRGEPTSIREFMRLIGVPERRPQ